MPPNVTRIRQIISAAATGRTQSFVSGGQTVNVLVGHVDADHVHEIEGYRAQYNCSVWLLSADALTTIPQATASVTLAGTTRRVLGTWADSLGATVRIDLGAKYA